MTLKQIAELIRSTESDFCGEDGFYDREYIMERFGLNRKQWKDLLRILETMQ